MKAASEVPIELEFRKSNQVTAMPEGASYELILKPKGKPDAACLVRHLAFSLAAGNLYAAFVNTNTAPLLAALGLTDGQSYNDILSLTADAEVAWKIDGRGFRSQTFAVVVESPLYRSGETLPPDAEPPYPASPDVLTKSGNLSGLSDQAEARANLGMGDVDNTSDSAKPVSVAVQSALDAKEPRLGAPQRDGDVLASSLAGVRGWVALPPPTIRHSVPNRFTSSHAGWKVGDIVLQSGDSSPQTAAITINSDVAGDEYYSGWTLAFGADDGFGGWAEAQLGYNPGPGEILAKETIAADLANAINSYVWFVTAEAAGDTVHVAANTFGPNAGNWNLYGLWDNWIDASISVTAGQDGVPPGSFVVVHTGSLDNADGYRGIGETVDFLSGYGAPPTSLGVEGNGYVDLNNGDFYHRDSAGWQFVLNIKGPPGPQGVAGSLSRIYNLGPGFSGLRGYSSAAEETLNQAGGSIGHTVGRIYHHRIVGTISGASGAVATIRLKINGTTFATHTMTFASAVTNAPFELDGYYSGSASVWFTGFSTFHTQLSSGVITSMKSIYVGSVASPLSITASVQFSTSSTANGMNVSQDYVEY